jgi:hypothetical protein
MCGKQVIWKDIAGYEGMYQINHKAEVRSFKSGVWKTIKDREDGLGYRMITLCKKGIRKNYKVHRLIMESFKPNKDNKPQVNHLNGDKSDNKLENLEWATSSENSLHAYRNKLNYAKSGSECNLSKLTEVEVILIRGLLNEGKLTQRAIADKFNVSPTAIYCIKKKINWKHLK